MEKIRADVLVVGAGPAGSTCAWELSKRGAKVILVDFKRAVGVPVQCAEFVPAQLFNSFPQLFTDKAIAQRVEKMIHFTPWGDVVEMSSPGYVLNREVFDSHIAQLAVKEGAQLFLRCIFLGFQDGVCLVEEIDTRRRFAVDADMVVGADGPRSRVAKLTGGGCSHFLTTAQVTLPLRVPLKDLLIYFREYIPGGYGWVFPKGSVANVGVGLDPAFGINVMEALRTFLKELLKEKVVEEKVLKRTGGWIPADGLIRPVRGKVLLVGDAGGFCHPITGGGIANAVMSGSMAGKALAEGKPEEFQEEAEDVFGPSINRAAIKRKLHMKSWDDLKKIIPITWIAFDEYWRVL